MWKWIKWFLLLVLVFFISVSGYYWYVQVYKTQFSSSELKQAESVLADGVTLTDPKDDFIMVESNDEKVSVGKVSPYRLAQFDIKSLQFGADQEYFYYKVNYFAPISKKAMSINGDPIHGYGSNFDVVDDSGKITAVLHTSAGWWPVVGTAINGTYYSTGPTGIEWPENARFSKEKNTDSKMAGGAGTDYQLGRFPLKTLGLTYGGKMNFDLECEGGSQKYSHAFADAFLGTGKSPAIITWTVGSKNYSVNNNPEPYSPDQSKASDSSSSGSEGVGDFESCAKKFPVLETYPEQCKTDDGKTFTKKESK